MFFSSIKHIFANYYVLSQQWQLVSLLLMWVTLFERKLVVQCVESEVMCCARNMFDFRIFMPNRTSSILYDTDLFNMFSIQYIYMYLVQSVCFFKKTCTTAQPFEQVIRFPSNRWILSVIRWIWITHGHLSNCSCSTFSWIEQAWIHSSKWHSEFWIWVLDIPLAHKIYNSIKKYLT